MADRLSESTPELGRSALLAQASTLPWNRIGVSGEAARGLGVPNPRGVARTAQQPRAPRVARLVPWLNIGLTIAETLQAIAGPAPIRRTEIAIGDGGDLAVVIYGKSYGGPQAGTAMFVRGVGGQPLGVTAVVASDGLHFDAGALQLAFGKPLPRVLAAAAAVAGNGPAGPIVLENRINEVHDNLSTNGLDARTLVFAKARFQPWQAHHLIPFAAIRDLPEPAQRAIGNAGWEMDSLENLVVLPGDELAYDAAPNFGVLPLHRGPHPRYNAEVAGRLRHLGREAPAVSGPAIRAELRVIEDLMFRRLLDRVRGYHRRVSLNDSSGASAVA